MSQGAAPSSAAKTPSDIAIAFCSDSLMEVPLHVAALSLLNHLAPGVRPHFYMLLTDFTPGMQDLLRKTLDRAERPYRITFLSDSKTQVFTSFRALLGNYAPYYRLLLPDLIEEPTYLYIDSDTQPMIDVSPLFQLDMGRHAAGFVMDGKIKTALEKDFFLSLGMNPEGAAFNSGVMLVQPEEWKRQDWWNRIKAFCEKYAEKLLAADQTVLNALMAEDCFHLPLNYNIKVYARRTSKVGTAPGLYHYLGSPKPWDFLGKTMLPYSKSWFGMLKHTALTPTQRRLWMQSAYWKRAPHVMGGYYRMFKNMGK